MVSPSLRFRPRASSLKHAPTYTEQLCHRQSCVNRTYGESRAQNHVKNAWFLPFLLSCLGEQAHFGTMPDIQMVATASIFEVRRSNWLPWACIHAGLRWCEAHGLRPSKLIYCHYVHTVIMYRHTLFILFQNYMYTSVRSLSGLASTAKTPYPPTETSAEHCIRRSSDSSIPRWAVH